MAHNLATINGRTAMAYQGETPWHKLGHRLDSMTSVEQALVAGGLDWNVGLQPMYLGDGREVTSRRAIVRDVDNAILNTVGTAYTLVQNRDAFAILQPAVESMGCTIETAGALGNGERVWMLARLPESIEPVAGDKLNGYMLATTGHGDSIAFKTILTLIRVVCQNTLGAATTKDTPSIVHLPHLPGVNVRLDEAKKMVSKMLQAMKETGDTFAEMARRRMSATDVVKYIERVFPTPKDGIVSKQLAQRRADVGQLVWTGVGADLAGSTASGTTAWAAYNAVTEYFDHVVTGTAKTPGAIARANESAIFGQYAGIKTDALVAARELVAA
jgi:phage/plasmid-like protein (TIGR03299 family)